MDSFRRAFDASFADDAMWRGVSTGCCHVALVVVDAWLPWLDHAPGLLDAADTQRMQSQRRPGDRQERAIAYALHRLLLARALRCDPRAVPLVRDALGCPRLSDGALHTSLSHADGHVALALCRDAPVGVDIEPLSRASSMAEIAGHVCHPDEALSLAGLNAEDYGRSLLALWVRKEAVLKSAGVGLRRDMTGFVASAGDMLAAGAGEVADTVVQMVDAGPRCCAAVAVGVDQSIESRWLRPA